MKVWSVRCRVRLVKEAGRARRVRSDVVSPFFLPHPDPRVPRPMVSSINESFVTAAKISDLRTNLCPKIVFVYQ